MGYNDEQYEEKSWTCCGWFWWCLVALFGLVAIGGLFPLFTGSSVGSFNNVVGIKVNNAEFEVKYKVAGVEQKEKVKVGINLLVNPIWKIEYGLDFTVNGERKQCATNKPIVCSDNWIKCTETTWLWIFFGGYLVLLFAAICFSCINWNKVALLTVILALGCAGGGFYFIYDSSSSYVQNLSDWKKVQEFICMATADKNPECIQKFAETCDNKKTVPITGMALPITSSAIGLYTQNGLFAIAGALVCLIFFIVGIMIFTCCASRCCVRKDSGDTMVSL